MHNSFKFLVVCGSLQVLTLALVACGPKHEAPVTVGDMMDDRVVLDGILLKCSRTPSKMNSDPDCINARVAIERLAKVNELGEEKKHAEDFERVREQLRVPEARNHQMDTHPKVDGYSLPVVPVEPAESPVSAAAPVPAPASSPPKP